MYYTFFLASLALLGSFHRSTASCCPLSDIIEESEQSHFLVPIPGIACLKVELYPGGKLLIDPKDPTCVSQNFLRGSVANYDSYIGNVATFGEGQFGKRSTVFFVEDESLSDPEYNVIVEGNLIEIMMKFPSCSMMGPTLNWIQLGPDIVGKEADDYLGWISLSEDGKTIAVGAPGADGDVGGTGSVGVYVFNEDNVEWDQLGSDIYGEENDRLGYSLSISGNGEKVAIGSRMNDGNGVNSGVVRVYEYGEQMNDWVQIGQDIVGENSNDYYNSVSLSDDGNTIVTGAGSNSDNGLRAGNARVFVYDDVDNMWVQRGRDIDGEDDYGYSGHSVSMARNGDTIAVGSWTNFVQVFAYNSFMSDWVQIGENIDVEVAWLGSSVSLSKNGNIVAVHTLSNPEDSYIGNVRVYSYDSYNFDWVQMGSDIPGDSNGVSIADNGKIIAVGFRRIDGVQSKSVRIYSYNESDGDWSQIGDVIYEENYDCESRFDKQSLSLAGDGYTLAIGFTYGGGTTSGHVRIFKYAAE